jgi:hypothetical protein
MTDKLWFDTGIFQARLSDLGKSTECMASNTMQLQHLIAFLACQLLPKRLIISSYSLGEEACRMLHFIRHNQLAGEVRLILDSSIKATGLAYMLFAKEAVDGIYLVPNHTKLIFFDCKTPISVISSANLNKHQRWETTIVSGDQQMTQFVRKTLNNIMQDAIPFE